MRAFALLIALMILVTALTPIIGVAVGTGPTQEQNADGAKDGPTDASVRENVEAGRNFTSVEMGGSTFGILYGTEADPGPVTIFTRCPMYLGDAEITGQNGVSLGKRSIVATTYTEHSLVALVEFEDANRNGLYDATTYSTSATTMVKAEVRSASAGLYTAWEMDHEEHESGDTTVHTFVLTARNLTVHGPTRTVKERAVLGALVLEITLTIDRETSEDRIPVYDVKVDPGGKSVTSVTLKGERTATAIHTSGHFKYNVSIDDWPTGTGDALILLTNTRMGISANRETLRWADSGVIDKISARGEAVFTAADETHYRTSTDLRSDDNDDGIPESIQARKRIRLEARRTVMADLSWVDHALVDGDNISVRFSVLKIGLTRFTNDNRTFTGIGILGGFVYPAGSDIFHDPGLAAEGTEITFDEVMRDLLPGTTILIQIVSGVAIAVLAFAKRRR